MKKRKKKYANGTGGGPSTPKKDMDDMDIQILDLACPATVDGYPDVLESPVPFNTGSNANNVSCSLLFRAVLHFKLVLF